MIGRGPIARTGLATVALLAALLFALPLLGLLVRTPWGELPALLQQPADLVVRREAVGDRVDLAQKGHQLVQRHAGVPGQPVLDDLLAGLHGGGWLGTGGGARQFRGERG